MKDKSDIINFEIMGGWPIYKKTLKELLESLGAIWRDGVLGFEDSPILNKTVITLEDDGMGYGINKEYITEASTSDGYDCINLFRDIKLPQEKLDEEIKKHFHE